MKNKVAINNGNKLDDLIKRIRDGSRENKTSKLYL